MSVPQKTSTASAIELQNLTLGHEKQATVKDASLRIEAGSLVAVVGPNGAGKSTLIKALAGELKPMSGSLRGIHGQRVACLPQRAALDRSFPINLRDMVTLGLWHCVGALGRFTAEHRRLCDDALQQTGLGGLETRPLDTLSGGQLQRALFARLILQDAPVVLLDEPFAAVDNHTTHELLTLLNRWHAQGKTVIVALHDLAQVHRHFPLTLALAHGNAIFGPTAEVLMRHHGQQPMALCCVEPVELEAAESEATA